MNQKEQQRVVVLGRLDRGQLTAGEAADVMGLSVRQVRRLLAAYRQEGAAALAHGNRGRAPAHALTVDMRQRIVELAKTKYVRCNHQHMSELLGEREQIKVSRSALRRILVGAGIRSPRKRRPPKHRSRRERRPQEGMLLQTDASPHDWLEGRGPWLTLVGLIDDATGKVPAAEFREQEDAQGYFVVLQTVVLTHGRPLALYHDGHGIFVRPPQERETLDEQLAGQAAPTQFGRLLAELGISSIRARSPQAKGRIERLWGTFQDRLVTELRLAGATTLAEANRVLLRPVLRIPARWRQGATTLAEANRVLQDFLPRYNRRFAVPATQAELAYRPVEPGFAPEQVFCFKYVRTVAADNTVRFGGHRLQIRPDRSRVSYAHAKVEVHERLDGSLAVYYQGRCLTTQPAPMEAPVLRARKGPSRVPLLAGQATAGGGGGRRPAATARRRGGGDSRHDDGRERRSGGAPDGENPSKTEPGSSLAKTTQGSNGDKITQQLA
ncbi:MAG: ISNCY family transposase [Chloroflexi bacterium]|nr:ISNCY family transposase [Chloroflexota bacterium]